MIAVLLAVYNSGRFLREQIDSIFAQTFSDWKIFVHDDGSTDDTLSILQSYIEAWPDKIAFIDNRATGLRACGSFLALQEAVKADYYMFSDHDDVWLPDKMELSVKRMQEVETLHPDRPVIVHTDMKVVDSALNVIGDSFWTYMKLLPDHCSFAELAVCHCVNGCTILFNDQAKRLIGRGKDRALMHDILLSESVAEAGGIISAVRQPTVLYRQHGDNVLGAASITGNGLARRFFRLKEVFRESEKSRRAACAVRRLTRLEFYLVKMKIEVLRLWRYR